MRKKNKQKKEKKNAKEQAEKKLSDVVAKVKLSDDNLEPYTKRFVRFYKLYRSYLEKGQWPTKSKMFNPLVFSLIETQTAKMVSSKPIGEWKPAGKTKIGDPEKIQMAFDEWWREERAILKSQDTFKKTAMYGGASVQMYWKFVKGFKLGKPFVKISRPGIRILRLEDKMFGFDPESDSFEDGKWSFIRYPITKKELEDLKESPLSENYQNLDEAINSFTADEGYDQEGLMQDRKDVIDSKNQKDDTIKKAECIYLENYETGDVIITVGRKHIIQDKKNPHLSERSLILTNTVRVPSETLGMSDIEPIETLQHGVNLFRNQRADNIDGILKPQWITSDVDVDDDELTDEDSLVVHAKDISKTKQLPKNNVTATAFKEDEAIKNDVYAATSVTPFSMGNDNDVKGDRSGVAISRLQSASDARIKSKMMNFEVTFIKEVAEKWQRLMAQYQTEDIIVDDNGKEVIITPKDLGHSEDGEFGEWNFHVESGSTQHVNDIESREDYLAFHNKILELAKLKKEDSAPVEPQVDPMTQQPIPAPEPIQVIDYDKMAEKLSEKFGQKDWREVWMVEEELEEEMGEEQGEMLPGLDPEAPQGEPQGEMLPSIETPQGAEMVQGEAPQEMLPSVENQEMLPAVGEGGFLNKIKSLFRRNKKPQGEMLPPI